MKKFKSFLVMALCTVGVVLMCGLESGLLFKLF